MSRMKTDATPQKRAMLNTTINEQVLDEFKAYCKEIGFPMNVVLESFMSQFSSGEFVLKIAKGNKLTVDLEDE